MFNLFKSWTTKKEPSQPEPVSCTVYVIGGAFDKRIMQAVDHGETLIVEGITDNVGEYSLTTWGGIGGTKRVLVHRSFDSADIFNLLLNEYCDRRVEHDAY